MDLPVLPRYPSSPSRLSTSDKGTRLLRMKSDKGTKLLRMEDKGNINFKNPKTFKDAHDIDKNITEAIRDNEELNNTIKKITEKGIMGDGNIVNMLNDMMVEGKEKIVKLLNLHRAASAPISRAGSTPIRCGSGECYPTGVSAPKGVRTTGG